MNSKSSEPGLGTYILKTETEIEAETRHSRDRPKSRPGIYTGPLATPKVQLKREKPRQFQKRVRLNHLELLTETVLAACLKYIKVRIEIRQAVGKKNKKKRNPKKRLNIDAFFQDGDRDRRD